VVSQVYSCHVINPIEAQREGDGGFRTTSWSRKSGGKLFVILHPNSQNIKEGELMRLDEESMKKGRVYVWRHEGDPKSNAGAGCFAVASSDMDYGKEYEVHFLGYLEDK
jgi:hypothetical protein